MSLQSYEAIYHDGQMQWLGETPTVKKAKVIVTMLEPMESSPKADQSAPYGSPALTPEEALAKFPGMDVALLPELLSTPCCSGCFRLA